LSPENNQDFYGTFTHQNITGLVVNDNLNDQSDIAGSLPHGASSTMECWRALLTGNRLEPGAALTASVSCEQLLYNNRIYILDRLGRLTPQGIVGELYIGGDGIARSLAGSAGTTASHFVPDQYSGLPGQRLHRTGYSVRYLEDGQLEFVDRVRQKVGA